jgi:hypothetical protein
MSNLIKGGYGSMSNLNAYGSMCSTSKQKLIMADKGSMKAL